MKIAPGRSGVTRAAKPKTIKAMPMIFFVLGDKFFTVCESITHRAAGNRPRLSARRRSPRAGHRLAVFAYWLNIAPAFDS